MRAKRKLRRAAVAALALAGLRPLPAKGAIYNDVLPGARAMGMGYAYTAVGEGPFGMFFNPAGLAGSDFSQLDGSLGRMASPLGPLSFESVAYVRPFPLRPNSVVGAAFFSERQRGGGDKDQVLFHFSEPVNLPQLYLTRPLKVGGNLKILNVDGTKGKKFGLGGDAGALLESNFGLKGGVSVTDLTPDLGVPNPSLNMGVAYLWDNWLLMATDLRVRRRLTQMLPGIEASLYQGLLKLRMGKGLPLDAEPQVAFGVGANFSPLIVDFAFTVPWRGFSRNAGAYQVTLGWRFGAPPFYGRYVGTAARQAEELKSEILVLEDKKRTLEVQASAAQATKDSVEGQLKAMELRGRSLQEELRKVEGQIEQRKYELATQPPPARAAEPAKAQPAAGKPARPAAAPFPRRHAVAAGDTLRGIAAQHYGDPNLWELVYEANPDKIERGLPQEGAVLTIPAPSRKEAR